MLPADALARATDALKRKRADTAKKIEEILAGQKVDLSSMKLPQEEDPGEPPLERLRRFARLLARAGDRLRTGEAERCGVCAGPITAVELTETPWTDTCRACAEKGQFATPPGGPAH
jgi:hypothetical protein